MTGRDPLAPYRALVRIAELELELASEARYGEIAQLAIQREQVIRDLSHPAPPGAREWLERALAIERRAKVELLRRREQVLLTLRGVELSRRTASGYARALPARRAQVLERA